MSATTDTILTVRCKAFAGDRTAREHRVMVGAGGAVRVFDAVAGYYTTCHSISERAQSRIRRLAAK